MAPNLAFLLHAIFVLGNFSLGLNISWPFKGEDATEVTNTPGYFKSILNYIREWGAGTGWDNSHYIQAQAVTQAWIYTCE